MDNVTLQTIPLKDIIPNRNQPRKLVDSLDELLANKEEHKRLQPIWEKVTGLASSILENGLQQPIIVYPAGDGKFVIYDGHRRWLAMQWLHRQGQDGNGTMQCYVRERPDQEHASLLGQLIVNMQREDFNVFELARSLEQIFEHLKHYGDTVKILNDKGEAEEWVLDATTSDGKIWEAIERMVGISQSRRYQIQAVRKLPDSIQQAAEEGGVPESKLRLLIPEENLIQEKVLQKIINEDLSAADIRKYIKELKSTGKKRPGSSVPKPVQIESALKPIHKLAQEMEQVTNIESAISKKDPRTVDRYRKVISELRSSLTDIQSVLDRLSYLEEAN